MKFNSELFQKVKVDVTSEVITKIVLWFLGGFLLFLIYVYQSFLKTEITIPIYVIFGSFLLGVLVLFMIHSIKNYFRKSYKDYRKDEFWGIVWTWDYTARKDVSNPSIQPICPECNSIMLPLSNGPDSTETYFVCMDDECDSNGFEDGIMLEGTYEVIQDRLSRKVDKNLRNEGLIK